MYTVIYRTGGYTAATWRPCRPVATMQEAVSQKGSLERGGRKAIIHTTSGLAAHGLPIGWCHKCDSTTGECTRVKGCRRNLDS